MCVGGGGSFDSDVIDFSALVTSGALVFQGSLWPRRLETVTAETPRVLTFLCSEP